VKIVKIRQVDAFTQVPFTGNPAGVVAAASGLTVKQMKLIAREMNLSETAFVFPPKTPAADMWLRWFTPSTEVDLCGHATIAAFHVLAEEKKYGMTRTGKFKYKVETRSGILPVEVTITNEQSPLISFGLPVPQFENFLYDADELGAALDTDPDNFQFSYPLAKDNFQAVLPIKSRELLFNLRPDFPLIEKICKKLQISALTVFTTDTVDKESLVHTRCFVPLLGVNEDPVTGSSLGPLGIYLAEQGIVKGDTEGFRFIAEQGDCLEKPGRVTVTFQKRKEGYHSLRIIGNAVTVLDGEIHFT